MATSTLLLFFSAVVVAVWGLSCVDEKGSDVDWYVLYKLPALKTSKDKLIKQGTAYMYITSGSSGDWTLSSLSMNDPKSMPGRTLAPIYDAEEYANILHGLYNDNPPLTEPATSYGHTKGAVMADASQGVWLVHSVPDFPIDPVTPNSDKRNHYQYPKTAMKFGQSFLCITLGQKNFDTLGQQLMFNKPKMYSSNVPNPMKKFVNLTLAVQGRYVKKQPWSSKAVLTSVGGEKFTSYAKSARFAKDLYASFVAPDVKSSLQVETWSNGAGGELPSDCKSPYEIMDVLDLAVKTKAGLDISFKNAQDHSKWAVSDESKSLVCIGDINRMKSQFKRGGGTVCFKDSNVWKRYTKLISDVQPCPAG